MKELDRTRLIEAMARIASEKFRVPFVAELAGLLGIESVLFFMRSNPHEVPKAASGFPQITPHDPSWAIFFTTCLAEGRHTANLPFPAGDVKKVTGLGWQNVAVLGLVGAVPTSHTLEELTLLLPLLAMALAPEHDSPPMNGENAQPLAEGEGLQQLRAELAQAHRDLAQLRAEAAAAAAKKDDFLAALSHELRTPLNPILLIASEAAENPKIARTVRHDFAAIAKSAELEARLIDDLLDITRITRGKMSLDKRGVDLRSVLEDAIATVRARLDTKKIDFAVTLASGAHSVFGDSARLQQVFWNLLKNAVKFSPAGGIVRLETHLDEGARRIAVRISDDGLGLTLGEAERFFDPSRPLDQASSPTGRHRTGGADVGMTISRMLVDLHGGTIEVTSNGSEQGVTSTVKLPLAAGGKPADTYAPFATSPKTAEPEIHARVLLIEDHEPTSNVLARLLKRRGFSVVIAASVAAAMTAAEKNQFDLVVSDIGLPDGDGHTLMAALQARYRLRGIAITGYGMQEDIGRSEAAGFIAHVTKPVSVRALEAALDLALPAGAKKAAPK